jgi:hypothetical protein
MFGRTGNLAGGAAEDRFELLRWLGGRRQNAGFSLVCSLFAAEQAGFEIVLTAYRRIRYQQNLTGRRLALVVLSSPAWPVVREHIPDIKAEVDAATAGSC